MNIDENKTNKKNNHIIIILKPLNYLVIAIVTVFSSFITYHFLNEYLYAERWWKYLNLGKLIIIFIVSSIFFASLFKIGNRLFKCSMSIQILIYSTGTIVSIYLIYYQHIPPIFLNKYIFYYPQYLNISLFFVIYYIVLFLGIFFMSIILDSIYLVITLKSKKEVEEKVAENTRDVNPYKMPEYFDYQKRNISCEEKKGVKIFAIILLSLLCTIFIIKLLGVGLETKEIYFRAWVNYSIYIIIHLVIPLLLVSYFIFRLIFSKKETSDKVNKYIIKSEFLLLIVGMGAFLFMVKSGYQLMYHTPIEKEEKFGDYYLLCNNQYLFINSYEELTYYNHYNFFTKTKCSDDYFFTYMTDLTHDGNDETVIINISDISKNNQLAANIYVNDANGSAIWEQEAYLPSAGWASYYLCNIDGKTYLLSYMPRIGQGTGNYEYHLFYLDEDGRELIFSENAIIFDNYPSSADINLPVDDMVSFANEVNLYLNQGYLLISTWDGKLQYSAPQKKIIYQESYENLYYPLASAKPDDLRERLNQYKKYLYKIWDEIK